VVCNFERVGEGGPDVVVLFFQALVPPRLLRPEQLRFGLFCQCQEVLGVRMFCVPGLPALLKLL
jgi:hypothetical protein